MATATRSKKKSESVLELPVSFGNVNIGDETARVGISISRANLTVSQADKNLCEKRLAGRIIARSNGASANQDSLPGLDDDAEIEGLFDVKGFSATGKQISTGLTFLLSTIDVQTLARFAKREGQLVVNGIEELPKDESGEE